MLTLKHIPVIIILTALLTLAGCGQDADEMAKLNSSIEELTGGAFEVPLHDDYPLIYASLRKPLDESSNGSYSISLHYTEERYPVKAHLTETYINELESHGISILYGPYRKQLHEPLEEGITFIIIEYSPVYKDAWDIIATRQYETETWDIFIEYLPNGPDDTGTWDINGQEIGYVYRGEETIVVYLQLPEAGINATYSLSDEFTEEDVKEFTAFLVDKLY